MICSMKYTGASRGAGAGAGAGAGETCYVQCAVCSVLLRVRSSNRVTQIKEEEKNLKD